MLASSFPISTKRLASLNHERRRRRRSKDDADIVAVGVPKPRKANLRRSALASNATEAQEISTLHNADLDTIICAVARVVYQYTVRNDSVRIGKSEASSSSQQTLDLFDEARHPLDDSGVWTAVPSMGTIEDFLYDIQEGLQLEDTCIVTALVMLERAVYGSSLVVAPRTWRVALLIALVIASKVVFDEDVFLGDFRANIAWLNDDVDLSEQEAVFLSMIDYNTMVNPRQYAQYYYALLDQAALAPPSPTQPQRPTGSR
jgi:hypothetical protein|tara:strand:- start:107 stop:883 length:777 start_codon:yes stop_codon:yes gene_type:complete